jgi:hypothetical protein
MQIKKREARRRFIRVILSGASGVLVGFTALLLGSNRSKTPILMSKNLIRKEGLDDYATGKDGQRKTIYAGNESIKFLKPNELLPENLAP